MLRYNDGEIECINITKVKIEFVDAPSQPSPSSCASPQKSASEKVATQQKSSNTVPTRTSTVTPQKKAAARASHKDDSEDAYIPKEEESSDDPIPMDVESSEDEPIVSSHSRLFEW